MMSGISYTSTGVHQGCVIPVFGPDVRQQRKWGLEKTPNTHPWLQFREG